MKRPAVNQQEQHNKKVAKVILVTGQCEEVRCQIKRAVKCIRLE